jgi:hypothetical protein
MSSDPERGPEDGPPDQPEVTADAKRREDVGRFAQYTAPTTLALLLSTQVASASVPV